MKPYNISLNNLCWRKTEMAFQVLGLMIAINTVVALITISGIMNADLVSRMAKSMDQI